MSAVVAERSAGVTRLWAAAEGRGSWPGTVGSPTAASPTHPQSQVLRIYISSEADLYFLHVLELAEEEYAVLRQDQDIRVDFANFPGKLIGLLDKCIAGRAEDLPR